MPAPFDSVPPSPSRHADSEKENQSYTSSAGASEAVLCPANRPDTQLAPPETETKPWGVKDAPHDLGFGRETELQDQTNLLPTRQVLLVFAGLSAAMFCKASLHNRYIADCPARFHA
jgi:hypothetical protein